MTSDRFPAPPAPADDPERERLEALLDAHVDGTLDPAGAAELQGLLADPLRRRELHRYAVLNGGLHEAFTSASGSGIAAAGTSAASAGAPVAPRRTGWWSSGRGRASLAAAGLAVLLAAWAVLTPRTPGAPGVLVRSAGPDASLIHRVRILKPAPDMRLAVGDHITGTFQLDWADGTTLSAEAGTDLEIGPGPGITLDLVIGSIRMEVSPQPAGRPLSVRSQHGSATVVGTRFALAVTPEDSRLTVDHGAVDFRSIDGSPPRRATSGMELVTDGHGPPVAASSSSSPAAGAPQRLVFDAAAEHGVGWDGKPVAQGVRAVRREGDGWACGTKQAPTAAGLTTAGNSFRVRASCSTARATQVGILITINDARTGAFLCNRQAIRNVPAGVPAIIECGWEELAYVVGPVAGPDSRLRGQAVSRVFAFAWGDDPGLVLHRVELVPGSR